jgi:hypothetical protein
MDVRTHYTVYEFNRVMGSEKHLSLAKVEFSGWVSNSFNTEQEAIDALIKDNKTYENFVILKEVYIN